MPHGGELVFPLLHACMHASCCAGLPAASLPPPGRLPRCFHRCHLPARRAWRRRWHPHERRMLPRARPTGCSCTLSLGWATSARPACGSTPSRFSTPTCGQAASASRLPPTLSRLPCSALPSPRIPLPISSTFSQWRDYRRGRGAVSVCRASSGGDRSGRGALTDGSDKGVGQLEEIEQSGGMDELCL